jgi:nucleotide-binding universal stress UspA family protein
MKDSKDGRFRVLWVVDSFSGSATASSRAVSEFLRRFSSRMGTEILPVPAVGSDAKSVLDRAEEEGVDLIALSTRGSGTETIAERSPIPVIVVPSGGETGVSRKTLFPTDFSRGSLVAFERFSEIAARQRWSVTLFHEEAAFSGETEERKQSEVFVAVAKRLGIPIEFRSGPRIDGRSIEEAILEEAKRGYGLVALGGIAPRLIRHSGIPVWIVRPSREAEAIVSPRRRFVPHPLSDRDLRV